MNVDALFFLEREMEDGEMTSLCGGSAAVFTRPAPGRARPNEDAALLASLGREHAVLAVADGAGGEAAGVKASALALKTLAANLKRAANGDVKLREAILAGFEAANAEVSGLGVGAATTLAVAELEGRKVRTYHVGDSGALVVGQRGKRKLQTIAHSPVGYAIEAGVISERQAMSHEERHLVSNMIGSSAMKIEMSSVLELAPRDTLLLASDGLFDNLHADEILEIIRKGPLESVVARLAEKAAGRMETPAATVPSKRDDLTFVVFRPA